MIAIIILNYNTPKQTISCIESIKNKTNNIYKYKIFVVDNCSTDNSIEFLKHRIDAGVELIESNINGGYSSGNNLILEKLDIKSYDSVCIMNSDIILNNDAISIMKETLDDNKSIAVVGPSVLNIEGAESQLLRKNYDFFLYLFSKKPLAYLQNVRTEFDYPTNDKEEFLFKGMVCGCCFMINSSIFKKINYFDTNVFLYSEEWIIGKKLEKLGLYTAFQPKASVTHMHAASTTKEGKAFQSYHLYLSAFYYLKVYANTNKLALMYCYIQNLSVFLIRSLKQNDYRSLLKKFVKQNTRLLLADRYVDNIKNKILK